MLITGPDNLYPEGTGTIDWTAQPRFEFDTEADALETLQLLADDLRAAREQERQLLRYMEAAAVAARRGAGEDGPVTPQAIINHTGVARRTVYKWIGEKD